MFNKTDIKKVSINDPVYIRSGRHDSHLFARARVLTIDLQLLLVGLGSVKVLYRGGFKAEKIKPFSHRGINDVWIRGTDAELSIKSPFSLVGKDFECFLTDKGLICRQSGNHLRFDEGAVCAWTKSSGLVIGQGNKTVLLNGPTNNIMFVLDKAERVVWENLEQLGI